MRQSRESCGAIILRQGFNQMWLKSSPIKSVSRKQALILGCALSMTIKPDYNSSLPVREHTDDLVAPYTGHLICHKFGCESIKHSHFHMELCQASCTTAAIKNQQYIRCNCFQVSDRTDAHSTRSHSKQKNSVTGVRCHRKINSTQGGWWGVQHY